MTDEKHERCKVLGRTVEGLHVQRADGRCGVISKVHQGEYIPPEAEVVQIGHASHSDDDECAVELTTLVPARKGPSRVASRRYRSGWDQTFGKPASEVN